MNLSDIARALGGKITGQEVIAPGPNHSRKDSSMAVYVDDQAPDGFVVHSFSGDDPLLCKDYVRQKMGLEPWRPARQPDANGVTRFPANSNQIVAEYVYLDADGNPITKVTRSASKKFFQFRWEGGSWVAGTTGIPQIPYRLPELLARPDDPVFLVEGEKDADRLHALGLLGTTERGGAPAWSGQIAPWLKDRDVFVIADNDEPGRKRADRAMMSLPHARQIHLQGLKVKGDISDWLDAGHTVDELMQLALSPLDHADRPFSLRRFTGDVPPPRPWSYGTLLMVGAVTGIAAPPGVGKTTFSMQLAIAFAMDQKFGPWEPRPGGGGKVWIYNGEEPQDELDRRFMAACREMGVMEDKAAKRVAYNSGLDERLKLIVVDENGGPQRSPDVDLIKDHIRENGIKLFLIDPLIEFNGGAKEDNETFHAMGALLREIGHDCECSVGFFHHTPKAATGDTSAGDMNAMRGGGPIIGVARFVLTMFSMTTQDAEKYAIPISERRQYVRIDDAKVSMGPRSGEPQWWKLCGMGIDNAQGVRPADMIGVLRAVGLNEGGSSPAQATDGKRLVAIDRISEEIVRVCISNGFVTADTATSLNALVRRLDQDRIGYKHRAIEAMVQSEFGQGREWEGCRIVIRTIAGSKYVARRVFVEGATT